MNPSIPSISSVGVSWLKFPQDEEIGLLRRMPGAARTDYEFLLRHARMNGPRITMRDRVAAAKCGICRRTWQKGLQQLQKMGLIERTGRGLNRIIDVVIFDLFLKPKKRAAKSDATKVEIPASTEVAPVAPPQAPAPISAEEQEQVRAEFKRFRSQTAPSPKVTSNEERARLMEESRRRQLDALAAMRSERLAASSTEQARSPKIEPPHRE